MVILLGSQNNESSGYGWKVYKGLGTQDGSVEVTFDGEMLRLIQEKNGLLVMMK